MVGAGVQRCRRQSLPCSPLVPRPLFSGDPGEHPESQSNANLLYDKAQHGSCGRGECLTRLVWGGDSPRHCPPRGQLECQAGSDKTPGRGGAFTLPTRWRLQGFKQRVDWIIHISSFWSWQEGWAGGLEGCGCSWGKGDGETLAGSELKAVGPGKGCKWRPSHQHPVPSSAAPGACDCSRNQGGETSFVSRLLAK